LDESLDCRASWPGIAVRRTASLSLAYAGHPRLAYGADHKDVDARHKAGHDENNRHDQTKGPGKTGAFDLKPGA
jgi:hypothetical protein